MESWPIDDDRLSFIHSSRPFGFGLYNREGPNRVEIFDITRIPGCRTAISETTCLCDIFGDDCESPTPCSSPPSGSLGKAEVDGVALAEDTPSGLLGSYHAANGSEQLSDSSDTYEDSKETLSSPEPLWPASSPEARGASPFSKPNGPELSPDPQVTPVSAQSKETTSSRSIAPISLSQEPRSTNISSKQRTTDTPPDSSIEFPSLETSCLGLSSEHRSVDICPISAATANPYKDRGAAPSPELRDRDVFYDATATSPTPEDCVILHTLGPRGTELRITPIPPEAGSAPLEIQPWVTPAKLEPRVTSLTAESSVSPPELEFRVKIPESEPRNISLEMELGALTAEPKPRATYPEPGAWGKSPGIKPTAELESWTMPSKLEPSFTALEPEPRGKSPEIKPSAISPKKQLIATLPKLTAQPIGPEFRTPSPEPELNGRPPGPDIKLASAEPTSRSLEQEFRAPSPEPEASTTSLEPEFRAISPEPQPSAGSSAQEFRALSPQPEPSATPPEPELRTQSQEPEPSGRSPEPESRALSYESKPNFTSFEPEPLDESPERKPSAISPQLITTMPEPKPTARPIEPEFKTPEPELSVSLPGPEVNTASTETSARSTEPELMVPSPEPEPSSTSSESEFKTPSPEPQHSARSPEQEFRAPSPEPEPSTTSSEAEFWTPSPQPEPRAVSPKLESISTYSEPNTIHPSAEGRISASYPKLRGPEVSIEPEASFPAAKSIGSVLLPETTKSEPRAEAEPGAQSPEPEFRTPSLEPDHSALSTEPEFRAVSPEPEPCNASPETEFKTSSLQTEANARYPELEFRNSSPESEPAARPPEPEFRAPTPEAEPNGKSPEQDFMTPSPEPEPNARYPEPELRTFPEPEYGGRSAEVEFKTPPLEPEPSPTSSEPEFRTPTPELEPKAASPQPEPRSTYPELNTIYPSAEGIISAHSPKPRGPEVSNEPKASFPSAESIGTVLFQETTISEPRASGLTQSPRITDASHEPRQSKLSPEPRSSSLSWKSNTTTHGLEICCSAASPEAQSTVLSHEEQNSEISSEPSHPTISAECINSDLFELKSHTPENSGAPEMLELGDQDQLLKPKTEPPDTSCPPKLCKKAAGGMTAALENSRASKGLQSALPQCASEAALIGHPSSEKSKAALSKENAAEGPKAFSSPQRPEDLASGESPTVPHRQGGGQPHGDGGQREGGEEEHKRGEQGGDEGEGNREKATYREQQVELSFSARNRRAPVSPSSAATGSELRRGMPAGCYSDCLLVTRQQQQQNALRPHSSQKENQACARKPRLVPRPVRSGASCPAPEHSGEISSMGSELDEADNEVKWFSDLAFRSLSSPQADYLDVYNSSHRSSTNVSQLSTEDSPGASAWSAYADLQGSIRHEGGSIPHQPPMGLTPDRRFEMGSFECVDVVVENREDFRRGKRTVPKRQIQLKRRDTVESQASENDEAATDAANEAAPVHRYSRDALVRQHSTPAAIQEHKQVKPEPSERKQKLTKSISLDETSSKTKTASCLIKSVLSKKMQHTQDLTISQPCFQSEESCSTMGKTVFPEGSQLVGETPKMQGQNLGSELPSDCSLLEEDLPNPMGRSNRIKQHRSFNPKPKPERLCSYSYGSLQSGASSLQLQKNNTGKLAMRSELVIPFESAKTEKQSGSRETWKQSSRETEKQMSEEKENESDKETEKERNKVMEKQYDTEWKWSNSGTEKQRGRDGVKMHTNENLYEEHANDSANAMSGNTGAGATRAPGTPSGMPNRNQECYARSENYKQQSARNIFMSKTPEIMLKPSTTKEKKKSSVKIDCLAGDSEPKREKSSMACSPKGPPEKETQNYKMEKKTEVHTENGEVLEKSKPKGPVHKVRDVRKLVKNTYNLSFKATAVLAQDSTSQAEPEKSPSMQIEYISRKVEGLPPSWLGEKQAEGERYVHPQGLTHVPVQVQSWGSAQVHSQEPAQVSAQVHSQEPTQVSPQVHSPEPAQVSAQVRPQVPTHLPLQKVTQTASLNIIPRGRLAAAGAGAVDTVATEANATTASESGTHEEGLPRSGTRHPKLGSTPRLPSREREMSTLMYLQNGPAEGELEPGALPPIGLTATSCSRSVSMLLKEKGFQADIGVCDAPADDPNATPKHINRLEVPLQTSSTDQAPSEPSGPVPPPACTSPSTPAQLRDPREECHPMIPTHPELGGLGLERTSLEAREYNTTVRDSTSSSHQTPAAPVTSNNIAQLTGVKTVSTCTRQPAAATTGSTSSNYNHQSASAATQIYSDTQTSTVLATSSKMSQPAMSATSNYKQKPLLSSNPQLPNLMHGDTREQVALVSSCSLSSSQSSLSTAGQSPGSPQQPAISITSTKRVESDSRRYYASDDPPSYDERESFSPLLLTDLYSRKQNRYHPPVPAPPCSCAGDGVPSHGPPDVTNPAPELSTAQAPPTHAQGPPSLTAPPPVRHHHHHHQQRSDHRSLSYQPGSPKAAQPSLAQPPHQFQPLQHLPPGLPVFPPPLQQSRPEISRQLPPGLPGDRRSGHHRSPHQPPSLSGSSTYSSQSTTSPGVPLDVRPPYLCSPQGFVSSYGSEFGSEGGGGGGMMFPEGGGGLGYGQNQRRVLLDPETGKYFYIEVPMQPQPLRKMLFDPEMGQYVEVLIPQQTLPPSSMYPPVAAPYPSMHNPGMYAPQYLPYSVPSHSQPPSPRHPEAPPPQGLHQNSGGFGTPRTQTPKSDPQNHPPVDQGYLESMYYIPTGMTASPNPAPPEFYQKLPPSLPNSGGKRS